MSQTDSIKAKAYEIGFDLVGVSSANPHPHIEFYNQWTAKGYQGTMDWMVRHSEKKADPQKILPGVKSLLVCGLSYNKPYPRSTETNQEGRGWISNYAWGDDYHEVVLNKLKQLEAYLKEVAPESQSKAYVDTGAILERSYGQSAGLGWIGKNTLLINTKKGSFFFIGEILTTLELNPDTPDNDHCGTCTRCLDACPTQALAPYELNATKCISYLTIEHKGEIAPDLSQKMGWHLVGCDICQDVCPWNKKAEISEVSEFEPRDPLMAPDLNWSESLNPQEFASQFRNSSIKRLKIEKWQRNITIARRSQK